VTAAKAILAYLLPTFCDKCPATAEPNICPTPVIEFHREVQIDGKYRIFRAESQLPKYIAKDGRAIVTLLAIVS
jgi:hypothetical protein